MLKSRLLIAVVVLVVAFCAWSPRADGASDWPVTAKRILIVLDPQADDTDLRIAEVLKARIERRSAVTVTIARTSDEPADLKVCLGTPGRKGPLESYCAAQSVKLPGGRTPAPEGFAVKTMRLDSRPSVVLVGADHRGTLYSVGELLRRMRCAPDSAVLGEIDISTAPAYRFRGSSANQGGTMMKVTGARVWTLEELQDYTLDLALSGANCFYAHGPAFDFVKSFDMMVETGCRPNELPNPPAAWRATEMGNWVCPSIPEAHAALLKHWEEEFSKRKDFDVLRFFAGDPGGCQCKKCSPWGSTFIHLCGELSAIWLKTHSGTIILAANQGLDNAGDQAIFDYLNEAPRPWLYGLAYGPGSNAMSDYFRKELRDDLFIYPGGGPVNRYLAETLHQLPAQQRIVHYSDITHWISAQYQVENPDPYIRGFYGRRMFHARPKAFYRIFQEIMPFSEGDIIYSEGYHDEFHQYLWNRLLWEPQRSLDDVMLEYCRYYFGEDAAEPMKDALYQMEENLEAPFAANPGISRYCELVTEAGRRIPANLMAGDHRWRLHMQRADLDKYLQYKVRQGLDRQTRIQEAARTAADGKKPNQILRDISDILSEPKETEEMKGLRDEAGRLGEESNSLFGVRDVGYFSLDHPLRITSELTHMTEVAAAAKSKDEQQRLLKLIADYKPQEKLAAVLKK